MIVIYLEQEQQVMLIYLMFISIDQFWDFHTQHFRCEDLNAFKFDLRFYLLVGSFAIQHAQDRNLFLRLCHEIFMLEKVTLKQPVEQVTPTYFIDLLRLTDPIRVNQILEIQAQVLLIVDENFE